MHRLRIVERDCRAVPGQEFCACNSTPGSADDQNFLAFEFQRTYLSFSVDKLNNANKIANIKKRKTIFDSFQSCISKW